MSCGMLVWSVNTVGARAEDAKSLLFESSTGVYMLISWMALGFAFLTLAVLGIYYLRRSTQALERMLKRKYMKDSLNDSLGGAAGDDECLTHCLRYFGFNVVPNRPGRKRALEDGNLMLAGTGFCLLLEAPKDVRPGPYVKWFDHHFTCVVIRGGDIQVQEWDPSSEHVRERMYISLGDLDGCLADHIFFRVSCRILSRSRLLTSFAATWSPSRLLTTLATTWDWHPTSSLVTYSDHDVSRRSSTRLPFTIRFLPTKLRTNINRLSAIIQSQRAKKRKADMLAQSVQVPDSKRQHIALSKANALLRRRSRLYVPLLPPGWPSTDFPAYDADVSTLPDCLFLARLNKHDRDRDVIFYPGPHIYLIKGEKTLGSVTGLIKACVPPFNASAIIEGMRGGRLWPRPGYLRSQIPVDVLTQLATCADAPRLHALLSSRHAPEASDRATETEICEACLELKARRPELHQLIEALTLDDEDIIQMWAVNRDRASRDGTQMHYACEAWLNQVHIPQRIQDTVEFRLFQKFLLQMQGLTAYRTEWVIYADQERLAGSIDFVAVNEDTGELTLVDWKRSKAMRTKGELSYGKMMLGPCRTLPDSLLSHYRVQLNAYKWMLETYYDKIVSSMYIVGLHPDNGDDPFVDEVPDLHTEIEALMEEQRRRVMEHTRMAEHDLRGRDPFGGTLNNPSLIASASPAPSSLPQAPSVAGFFQSGVLADGGSFMRSAMRAEKDADLRVVTADGERFALVGVSVGQVVM